MSDEEYKNEITITISRRELEVILKCMDVTKDELGPFPTRHSFYKAYKKFKNLIMSKK